MWILFIPVGKEGNSFRHFLCDLLICDFPELVNLESTGGIKKNPNTVIVVLPKAGPV